MARRTVLLGLLLVVMGIGAAVLWTRRHVPCAQPIAYRLDRVDPRFGFTGDEVREALGRAEALWRRAAGRDLFAETPSARLAISLVYDDRQQTTQAAQRLQRSLRDTETTHAAYSRAYLDARGAYEARARDHADAQAGYQRRAQEYTARVQEWNARGGPPRDVQAALAAERGQLEEARRQLDAEGVVLAERAAEVNALAARSNSLAESHNRGAATFNTLYGAPRQFHKGEFDGREIAVFEFRDMGDLTLLLAHELGHALGIGHVDDPAAVMHAVAAGQVIEPLILAPADVAALRGRCTRL